MGDGRSGGARGRRASLVRKDILFCGKKDGDRDCLVPGLQWGGIKCTPRAVIVVKFEAKQKHLGRKTTTSLRAWGATALSVTPAIAW